MTNGKGTKTITWLHPRKTPPGRKPTYLCVCANYQPQKSDPFRIRWTVGGNLIIYHGDTYTPNANVITAKILLNSEVSTKLAKLLGINLTDFYLGTPMAHQEYMLIPLYMIPHEMIQEYDLMPLAHAGKVLEQIN